MDKPLSPKEFLKHRRPESFSDSEIVTTPILDRSTFEYTLDTLTSRSEEVSFENFARELAKREVCPNILPHTGPTGGGDSKVDAETYPVADDLSLMWYVGTGRDAATERWAFAFSAKKDWRSKVQSDVAKIAKTGRGYTKAFFVTNQFVKDKTRAEVEDALREKHAIDVRILDRIWILDRVFTNHHEQLAIERLDIQVSTRQEIKKGPLDTEREHELTELEASIAAATQDGHFTFGVVNDCIRTAQLARSMERPRTEVEGLLARAERVAREHGTDHQQLVAAYEQAKTAYWYFEDATAFIDAYARVEPLAQGSVNIYDLELLNNLWFLLRSATGEKSLDEQVVDFEGKTARLTAELERMTEEVTRPSAALQARTMLLHHRLIDIGLDDQHKVRSAVSDLLMQVLARAFLITNVEETLTKLLRDEQAIDRAVNFTSSLVVLGNILGDNPTTTLAAWKTRGGRDFALRRDEEWSTALCLPAQEKSFAGEPKYGIGDPPPELHDRERLKHTDIDNVSLIRLALWNRARWWATAFFVSPRSSDTPVLALVFEDRDAATAIFAALQEDVGRIDAKELLRVSILRGVEKHNPYAYTVVVGTNIPRDQLSPDKVVLMVSRFHTMHPDSNVNLQRFLNAYAARGGYFFMAAVRNGEGIDLLDDHYIGKRELNVRDAWQVGRHDPDAPAIREDDEPIVPDDQSEPPIADLLRARRAKK